MSIEAITWVFKHSEETLGRRLVLLALADYAHDDGSEAYPAVSSLAAKARMSERQVQRALRGMEADGTIVRDGKGPHGTTKWTIRKERGDNMSGVTNRAEIRPEMSPNPSLDPSGRDFSNEKSPSSSPESTTEPSRPTSKPGESNVKSIPAGSCMSNDKGSMGERDALAAPGASVLCDRLAERMRQRDPKAKTAERSTRWLEAADRLMRIDGREFEEAMKVLEFSQADQFWQTVILSMPKFREKYGALRAKWLNTQVRSAAAAQPQATVAELMAAYERPRARTGV